MTGKRKMWLAIISEFMAYSLTSNGELTSQAFVAVTGLIVGLFTGGNVGEWIAKVKNGGSNVS